MENFATQDTMTQTGDMVAENEENFDLADFFAADQPEDEPDEEVMPQDHEADEADKADEETANQPETYLLRHLDEEHAVTLAEMKELAQKGLDYGRIRAKYDEAKPQMEALKHLAKEAGVSPVEYLNQVSETVKSNQIAARANQLITDNYFDEKAAYEMARAEYENSLLISKVKDYETIEQERQREVQARQQQEETFKADLAMLVKMRPNLLSASTLPQAVLERVQKEGILPSVAYLDFELEQKNAELEQMKQTAKNEAKNPGSLKGEAKADSDPFLDGLFSDI